MTLARSQEMQRVRKLIVSSFKFQQSCEDMINSILACPCISNHQSPRCKRPTYKAVIRTSYTLTTSRRLMSLVNGFQRKISNLVGLASIVVEETGTCSMSE